MKSHMKRYAIALLITLFFVISVTAAVGVSMTLLQKNAVHVQETKCLVQSSMAVQDLLTFLKTSLLLTQIKDAQSLRSFLQRTSVLPLHLQNQSITIRMQSAMGRFNINTLSNFKPFSEALSVYMEQHEVRDAEYFEHLLLDCMSGQQSVTRTDIFDTLPWLYKNRIDSMEHFEQILDYYVLTRHDNAIKNIPWAQLIRFGSKNDTRIDANYITSELWQLLLPLINEDKARQLASSKSVYTTKEDLYLEEQDLEQLKAFHLSYYEPRVLINVDVKQNEQNIPIGFEYDLQSKKGGYFHYGL